MSEPKKIALPDFLALHITEKAGRSLRAAQKIPKDTVLLHISRPAISVIYRQYRKEVCALCFAYNLGRHWKLRDLDAGCWYCSERCWETWRSGLGEVGVEAYQCLGRWLLKKSNVQLSEERSERDGDTLMQEEASPKTVDEVEAAFSSISVQAELVREARLSETPSKRAKKMLNSVLSQTSVSADTLYLLLSGILCLFQAFTASESNQETELRMFKQELDLAIPYADCRPYLTHAELREHVESYLQLLAILPIELFPWITESSCRSVAGVLLHNVFGMRSHDTADFAIDTGTSAGLNQKMEEPGSELMGDMLLTTASLFNHSCSPNVRKVRTGRSWKFWADRDIEEGEECCITYIGGEEKTLDLQARQRSLDVGWGFKCACMICESEGRQDRRPV